MKRIFLPLVLVGRIHFTVQPPFRYTVEFTDSLGATNWSGLGTAASLGQTFETVVTDSVTSATSRFYRIRREICCH